MKLSRVLPQGNTLAALGSDDEVVWEEKRLPGTGFNWSDYKDGMWQTQELTGTVQAQSGGAEWRWVMLTWPDTWKRETSDLNAQAGLANSIYVHCFQMSFTGENSSEEDEKCRYQIYYWETEWLYLSSTAISKLLRTTENILNQHPVSTTR